MYTEPTSGDIKTRFVEFDAVDDTVVDIAIEDAAQTVGENWDDAPRRRAMLFLTAHKLTVGGALSGSSGTGAVVSTEVTDRLTSVKFEGFDISLSPLSQSESEQTQSLSSKYESTTYGQEYARLVRVNFAGVIVP